MGKEIFYAFLGLVIMSVTYDWDRRNRCEEAGGVYAAQTCFNKDAIKEFE